MKQIMVFFASLMPALLLVSLLGSTPLSSPMPGNEANLHIYSHTTDVQLASSPHQGEGVFICRPHQGEGVFISRS